MDVKTVNPLVSVITVVYNDKVNLEKTINSISNQDEQAFEYIVVDGNSNDGVEHLIEKYQNRVNQFVSEPDKGIYDAMNKGILLAKGKYVNFLNAGDTFHDENSLSTVFEALQADSPEILYGQASYIVKNDDGTDYSYLMGDMVNDETLYTKTAICHQTMFFKRDLFSELGLYSLEFNLVADYEWTVRYLMNRGNFQETLFLNNPIVNYSLDGVSFLNLGKVGKERLRVAKKHFSIFYQSLNFFIMIGMSVKSKVIPLLNRLRVMEYYRRMKYSLR